MEGEGGRRELGLAGEEEGLGRDGGVAFWRWLGRPTAAAGVESVS